MQGLLAPVVGETRPVKLNGVFAFFVALGNCSGNGGGLYVEHRLYAVAAGDRLCDADDQIRELYQLNEYLRHIVIERNDRAARYCARIDAQCADIYQRDYRKIDEHEGGWIHERRYPADRRLHLGQSLVFCVKVLDFFIFFAKRPDNAGAEQVFAGLAQKPV